MMLQEKHLRDREHFVLEVSLSSPTQFGANRKRIQGLIRCKGSTFLKVDKTFQILPNEKVETIRYAYHGGVSFPESRAVFRFDNAHGVHEQHVFDPITGVELGLPRELTREEWPYLSECLDMLEAWCYEFGSCGETERS